MVKSRDRSAWVRAGMRRLAAGGIENVRVEPLAKELGVTKGSFYWHFRDREDLHASMLEEWSKAATENVIDEAESGLAPPNGRLQRLFDIASTGFDGAFELAIRNWARQDASVAEVLEEVDRRRLGYLRRLLSESGFDPCAAESRAFLLYSALLGDFMLPRAHGRFSRKRILTETFELLGGAPNRRSDEK